MESTICIEEDLPVTPKGWYSSKELEKAQETYETIKGMEFNEKLLETSVSLSWVTYVALKLVGRVLDRSLSRSIRIPVLAWMEREVYGEESRLGNLLADLGMRPERHFRDLEFCGEPNPSPSALAELVAAELDHGLTAGDIMLGRCDLPPEERRNHIVVNSPRVTVNVSLAPGVHDILKLLVRLRLLTSISEVIRSAIGNWLDQCLWSNLVPAQALEDWTLITE